MKDTATALYSFFSSFGLPAFVENNIPDVMPVNGQLVEVKPPYITYELKEPEAGSRAALTARVWYIDTSFTDIVNKVDDIKDALKDGASLPVESGAIWLWPDEGFCQFQPPENTNLKIAYLRLIIGAYKF